jgi:Kef-type K+ transport system membrane component KefB
MDLTRGLEDLVAVALVAALAPLLVAILPGPRIPQVVIFLIGGVIIGPHVLGLAETSNIQLLANIGLGFLFLLAGYELDPLLLRQRPGELAIVGWLISAAIAVGIAAALAGAGYIKDYVPVGLALTTTALGTLLPILRDNDMLGGSFGQYVYAAGAVGELFPILIIAVFLTQRGHFVALASVALVGVLALALSAAPWLARSAVVQRTLREGQEATGQTTLRWAVVLLFALLALASRFGLDVVLGAVLAGMVLRGWTRRLGIDTDSLDRKFDAIGYGIFIPIFFISSGMTLDLKAISQDPARLLIFFVLLLIVRGLPSLVIYRHTLARRQRIEMTFITATSLPLLIALADIGQQDGVMLPATSAALVGAGVLSVLVYPQIAAGLHRSAPLTPADAEMTTAEPASAPPENDLQHVVARVRLARHGRDATQPPGLVVLEGLHQLGARVHDERPVSRDRLPDRLPAEQQDVHILSRISREPDRVARPEHCQLSHLHRPLLRPHGAAPGQHVPERVEVRLPRQPHLRARRHGGVHQGDRRMRHARPVMTPERPGDHPQQRPAVRRREQRHLGRADVLVARRRHLQPARQVDPQLEAVEQAAADHELLRRRLDVQQPGTRGHPLGVAVGDQPAAAVGVLVPERAVDDVGDGLEPAVRVPRGALGLTGTVVDLAHLVHVDERIEPRQVHAGEGAPDREALAFEAARGGGDRDDRPLGLGHVRLRHPGQYEDVVNGDCWHGFLLR